MTIKNLPKKPQVVITRLGKRPIHVKEHVYEHLKSQLNKPLPVSSATYLEDSAFSHIVIHLPEFRRTLENGDTLGEIVLFFPKDDVDITLTYVD